MPQGLGHFANLLLPRHPHSCYVRGTLSLSSTLLENFPTCFSDAARLTTCPSHPLVFQRPFFTSWWPSLWAHPPGPHCGLAQACCGFQERFPFIISSELVPPQRAFPSPSRTWAPPAQLSHQSTLTHDALGWDGTWFSSSRTQFCLRITTVYWYVGTKKGKHPHTPPYPDSATCYFILSLDPVQESNSRLVWCSFNEHTASFTMSKKLYHINQPKICLNLTLIFASLRRY